MKQAAEYRQHAAECRQLAMTSRTEKERCQLMQIAAAWERMAVDREAKIAQDAREPSGESLRSSGAPASRLSPDDPLSDKL
jgi:hypothetical protein